MKNSYTGDSRYRAQVVEFGRHAWLRAMWEKSCAGSSPALGRSNKSPVPGLFGFMPAVGPGPGQSSSTNKGIIHEY